MSDSRTDLLSQSFFSVFQVPESFDLASDTLTGRYQALQAMLHPDRFVQASEQEKRVSVQYSAFVNQAFQTLKSPLLRAIYLLAQRGIVFDQDAAGSLDSALLVEQMHWHEALAEVTHSENPSQELKKLQDELTEKIHDTECTFAQCWRKQTDVALEQARQLVMKMQFLNKISEKAKQLGNTLL